MLAEFIIILGIIYEEARRRRWFSVVRAAVVILGYIGISIVALHPLLKWLFPSSIVAAWVIMVSLFVVIFLLVAAHLIYSFHRRAAAEALAVWSENTGFLEQLYRLQLDGRELRNRCRRCKGASMPDGDMKEIRAWHEEVAGLLERKRGLEYRRRFYEHGATGEKAPDTPHQCDVWMDTRLIKLKQVIDELQEPPPQLIPPRAVKRIESRSGGVLETDED